MTLCSCSLLILVLKYNQISKMLQQVLLKLVFFLQCFLRIFNLPNQQSVKNLSLRDKEALHFIISIYINE
jgi:hypothetical protein